MQRVAVAAAVAAIGTFPWGWALVWMIWHRIPFPPSVM